MSKFEKIYHIDPSRESNQPRELHTSIEMSDEMIADARKEVQDSLHKNAQELISRLRKQKENKVIPLNQEHKGDQNEKSKSKSPKKKPKKANTKSNKSAMASLQKKL